MGEIGARWPGRGRNEGEGALRRDVVRLVMGHVRKTVPCVRLNGVGTVDCEVTVSCAECELSEVFSVRDGFVDEWLDVEISELERLVIEVKVCAEKMDPLTAVIIGAELAAGQGTLHRPLLGSKGFAGELIMDYLIMSSLPADVDAKFETGISDIKAPRFTGHRGSGGAGTHAIRENTSLSFIAATNRSVSHVELDVQLTREGTPVIYHDFHIAAGNKQGSRSCKIPIYSLGIDDWAELEPPVLSGDGSDESGYYSDDNADQMRSRKSANSPFARGKVDFEGHLKDFLPTLSMVCRECPPDVGLMLELKYPLPEWQEEFKLPFPSRDFFTNRVLDVVCGEENNKARSIIFSTFDADLAMLLKAKQKRFPVYFLTAETVEHMTDEYDSRCALGENAIEFAEAVHLDGMVFSLTVLLNKPGLVRMAHERNLQVMTYGVANSSAAMVNREFKLGVDGVIADNVNLLVNELQVEGVQSKNRSFSDIFERRSSGSNPPNAQSLSGNPEKAPLRPQAVQ